MKKQILEAIQKGVKSGLLESGFSFSLDDLDHMEDYGLKKKKLDRQFFKDEFDRQQYQYEKTTFLIIIDKIKNKQTLSDKEKEMFNKNSNEFIGIYKVNSPEELNHFIHNVIEQFGNKVKLNWIDVSNIDNMSFMFSSNDCIWFPDNFLDNSEFNGDISKWDVSNVSIMRYMFYSSKFNGDISKWDVSNVENMADMFYNSNFDNDISKWNVSNVKNMANMFEWSKFNGDIAEWDVSNVENMCSMFSNSNFNKDISKWNVSHAEDMCSMFSNSNFNRDIAKWDVSHVKNMAGMFSKSKFNGDIAEWDVSNVEDMSSIFSETKFNKDISNWNLSNTKRTSLMFYKCLIKNEYKPKL